MPIGYLRRFISIWRADGKVIQPCGHVNRYVVFSRLSSLSLGIASEGIDKETINDIQVRLNVHLPDDFCEITLFCNGGLFRDHSYTSSNGCTNIVDETIRLRKTVNLPLRFVVLAEPDESLVVMDTENTPSIIWCDATEVSKLDVKTFISKSDEWNTYAEFFAYLIEGEEEERTYE